jgi:hypothetical protein
MGVNESLDGYSRKMLKKRDTPISARFGTGGFSGVSRFVTRVSIVKTYSESDLIVLALAIHHLTRYGPDQPPSQSRGGVLMWILDPQKV